MEFFVDMEQLEKQSDECKVTVEVLPETVREVVYLTEQSSSSDNELGSPKDHVFKLEAPEDGDNPTVLYDDSSTYIVLAAQNDHNENAYITEEELQKNYFIVKSDAEPSEENSAQNVLYACEVCSADFEDYQALINHFNTKHPLFMCYICGCSCSSAITLMSHYKTHEPKLYCCEVCGVEYVNSVDFENHKKTHSTNLLYACNICDAPFDTTYNVSLHIRTVHSKQKNLKTKQYVCDPLSNESRKRLKR